MTHAERIKHALDHLVPLREDAASHPEAFTDQRENWRLMHLDAAIDLLLGRGTKDEEGEAMNAKQKRIALFHLRHIVIDDLYHAIRIEQYDADPELLRAMRAAVRALAKVKATKEKKRCRT